MDIQTATEHCAPRSARTRPGRDAEVRLRRRRRIVVDATQGAQHAVATTTRDGRLHGRARAWTTLGDLLSGELEPTTGFMMGKFKVSGDMSVAMKLQRMVVSG